MFVELLKLRARGTINLIVNCYLVSAHEAATSVLVIDPGASLTRIEAALKGRAVEGIVLTHGHFDHIGALGELAEKTGAPVYAHTRSNLAKNLNPFDPSAEGASIKPDVITHTVGNGDRITAAGLTLEVLYTPGHSRDSICLYSAEDAVLFSGDTLFYGTTGRTDLKDGSPRQMHKSLRRLALLPDETKILPGHDRATSIALERHRALVEY
ncbi:MAG: MBL fold metallo-hydrolase [Coriobacteriales bacterium]|jgi:glyoxylase-like metal-dependent hydrolase (beta-lactamase superfamily II)|nr:MBL fold metallo-hydrolase [Coriobacteriales bacterium]